MKFPELTQKEPRQKALSFDEYADFVWFFLKDADIERMREQKAREENIEIPFSLGGHDQRARPFCKDIQG